MTGAPVPRSASSAALLACACAAVAATALGGGEGLRQDVRVRASDGLSLFVRQYGAGPVPVVLLTGGPGYSGDYLEELAGWLSARHPVLLPDQRGTGRSVINPFDATRLTIDACAGDVEALRQHVEAEKLALVGHSWGGVLAMAYAARHPDRVQAMVLIGSGGIRSDWQAEYAANMFSRLSEQDLAAALQAQADLARDPHGALIRLIRATAPAMILDRQLALELADQYSGPATFSPAVTLAMQGWLNSYDLGKAPQQVRAPVLVIQGVHDPIGQRTARDIAQSFPDGDLRLIEAAAHEPYVEQPRAFRALLEPFLRQHVPARTDTQPAASQPAP